MNESESQMSEQPRLISTESLGLLDINPNDLGPLASKVSRMEDLIPGINSEGINSLDNLSQPSRDTLDDRVLTSRDQDVSYSGSFVGYLSYLKEKNLKN